MKKRRIFIWLPAFGACLLSLFVFAQLWQGESGGGAQVSGKGRSSTKTVLLAGVDEAGENTDMLMLCSLDTEAGRVRLLQIPRDTYYRTEKGTGKINRVYRSYVSKYGKKRAAEMLSEEIVAALGIPVDGYAVLNTQTVSAVVDILGGVPVDVPKAFSYFDTKTGRECTVPKGERLLNGEEAVAFVRHRKGYAEGDLGRLDAQMRFLSGVFSVLPSLKKIDRAMALYQKIMPNLLTNLTEKDIIEFMMAYFKNRPTYSVSLLRLPGEACYTDGAWYYVLYREATEAMLEGEYGLLRPFDEERRFTDTQTEALSNVYFSSGRAYRSYTPEEIASKKILRV